MDGIVLCHGQDQYHSRDSNEDVKAPNTGFYRMSIGGVEDVVRGAYSTNDADHSRNPHLKKSQPSSVRCVCVKTIPRSLYPTRFPMAPM